MMLTLRHIPPAELRRTYLHHRSQQATRKYARRRRCRLCAGRGGCGATSRLENTPTGERTEPR